MEITARLTRDAQVKTLPDDRQVVGFTVALNNRYRSKGTTKVETQFIDCSYWLTTKVAQYLTKGTLVGLYGNMGINAYVTSEGEPRANFTFHVNDLKIHGKTIRGEATVSPDTNSNNEPADDLPF